MIRQILSLSSVRCLPFIWGLLVFNTFGLKMFIDFASYNILKQFMFFHFVISVLITILIFKPSVTKKNIFHSIGFSLMGMPTYLFILMSGNITGLHLFTYYLFLTFIQIAILNFLKPLSKSFEFYRFFGLIIIIFLWGSSFVIESIPLMYNIISPLTISYHFALINEGIVHISTFIYLFLLVSVSTVTAYEK